MAVLPNLSELSLLTIGTKRSQTVVCTICTFPIRGGSVTLKPCKHRFHRRCISRWVKPHSNSTCPNCRADIDPDQLSKLRGNVTSSPGELDVEYGRHIDHPLSFPAWEQYHGEGRGKARGSLFLTQDTRAQAALKYLMLSQYWRKEYHEDEDAYLSETDPTVLEYTYLLWVMQRTFETEDWSQALLGSEGELRPPFTILEQILDDGIEFEHLHIHEEALVAWWEEHEAQVVSSFSALYRGDGMFG